MGTYNIGEVWWTLFPFDDIDETKRRPAIVIDEETIAVFAMKLTSKEKDSPYCIKIEDWKEAGLTVESFARIEQVVRIEEQNMIKKIGDLSERDLLKIMQLYAEHITGTFHEFSLLAITNPENKYLQVYDERWNCYLFPYYKTVDENKTNIDTRASELLNKEVTTNHVAYTVHCKYSVSDEVYKQYKHTLYKVDLSNVPENMVDDTFIIEGKRYAWKSIKELEADQNTMDKNDDVIAFVKTKCK